MDDEIKQLDELADTSAIDNLTKVFVLIGFLIFFWILEPTIKHKKKWILPIMLLPALMVIPTIQLWRYTRGRCFFLGSFCILIIFIDGVTKYSFATQLWIILRDLSIWPYYAVKFVFQTV